VDDDENVDDEVDDADCVRKTALCLDPIEKLRRHRHTISETMKERLRAVEMWFLRRMLKISWTEKKSNLEVRRAAGVQRTLVKTIRQGQLDFFGHVMRRQGKEVLVVTGKVEGRRARGRQRQKYLDSLSTCLEDTVSPTQLIRATEDRLLWHDMVASVVNDTAP